MAAELEGRVALVTGGSRGIGAAIARALARAGADVAVNYRSRGEEAEAVAADVHAAGRRAFVVKADVSHPDEVAAMARAVEDALGPVGVLVNNAGIAVRADVGSLDLARFDEAIAVNLRSAFLVTQAVLPAMRARRWGRLIFLSSVAARVGGVVGPHYAASKAGLEGLMHGYASQLVREGITANAIAPALIATDMVRENLRATPDRLPVGRFGTVDEVADMAVLLAANGFVTGQTLQPNGGLYFT